VKTFAPIILLPVICVVWWTNHREKTIKNLMNYLDSKYDEWEMQKLDLEILVNFRKENICNYLRLGELFFYFYVFELKFILVGRHMDQVEIESGISGTGGTGGENHHTLDNDDFMSSITMESTEGLMKGKYSFKTNSIQRLGANRVRNVV
jgi:hypothetical protein